MTDRRIFLALAMCVSFSLFAQAKTVAANPQNREATVPFVGCRADGQVGPQEAPTGKNKAVPIAAEAAQKLAYYKAEQGFGVLAPRGWYCFQTYGSNGSTLYVAPQSINTADLLSTTSSEFRGPAIQITQEYGDTSGRYGVAEMIARVFPARRVFIQNVIAEDKKIEGIGPQSWLHFGPYPKDKLTYRSQEIVEYQTPAHSDGLGTISRLQKNDHPISGVAILMGATPDLLQLSVRLSPDQTSLAQVIIQQTERDAADANSN